MSFLQDLDEMSEERLQREIDRRKALRAKGLCDYCERPPSSTPCRFPERHFKSAPVGVMLESKQNGVAT